MPKRIYVWDNGEDKLDRSIWFIESDLDERVVTELLNAAADAAARGGVIAVVRADAIVWRQARVETLATWFTCHGDDLVEWRTRSIHNALARVPLEVARDLAPRLYPSNAEIMAKCMGFEL